MAYKRGYVNILRNLPTISVIYTTAITIPNGSPGGCLASLHLGASVLIELRGFIEIL